MPLAASLTASVWSIRERWVDPQLKELRLSGKLQSPTAIRIPMLKYYESLAAHPTSSSSLCRWCTAFACAALLAGCSDSPTDAMTDSLTSGGAAGDTAAAGAMNVGGNPGGAPGGDSSAGANPGGAPMGGGADVGGMPDLGTGGETAGAGGELSEGGAAGEQAEGGAAGEGGDNPPTMSQGCGAMTWPDSDRYTIESSGMQREYVLDIPDGYDPNQPYRLFLTWHWRGGNANDVVNGAGNASRGAYYGLKERSEGTAIFVSPEGLVDNGVTGWANPGGRDIQFLKDMLDQLNSELCIDQDRIFSTGFSYGGMMSLSVGCSMGGVVRAIAPMAGAIFSGCEGGDLPVAFWGSHAPGDSVVDIDLGRAGRDEFLSRNGCGQESTPVENGCESYEGCETGYPVVWCEFSGDHFTPDYAPDATWEFFSQF